MIYVQVLKTQADLGVDVVTDGEMERGAYYMQVEYFMQNIISMSNISCRKLYAGRFFEELQQLNKATRAPGHQANVGAA